jgi:outer membrane receptor protein involved in Fe transport
MLSRRNVLSLAAVLASQLCIPGAAAAQTPPADQPAAPAAEEGKKSVVEEIVVTGSRIRRKDLSTPAPVTVLSREQVVASGKVSIGDFLQSLPEQSNAINTGVNNGGDGATRVNLRGVGTNRTLVLVNGRRLVPGGTGADGSADLNSIPTASIERIEVLKDGASAVYGSDAIAGVVNIITRRGWSGTEASAYTGISGHSDGATWDLNVTTGQTSDFGNVVFSAGFYNQKRVMAGDRKFSKFAQNFDQIDGVYSNGSGTIPAGRTVGLPATGGSPLLQNLNTNFASGSYIQDPNAGTAGTGACGTSASGLQSCWRPYLGAGLPEAGTVGDGYNFAPDNYLVTPQQRYSVYAAGDTRLGSFARGFFEASYLNRQSGQDLAPEPLNTDGEGVLVSATNAYNPFGADTFIRRRLTEFGRRRTRQDIDTFRVVGGLDGTLPDALGPLQGWFWDLSLNYGRTQGVNVKQGNLFIPNLAAALGPSFNDAGTWRCSTDGTAGGIIDGCVPLNLFGGPGSITPAMVNPLTFTGTARGTNQLTAFQANTSGELFRLMSDRAAGLAIGYEHRELSGSVVNDPITNAGLTTGNKSTDTRGSYKVNEVYGELSIPIVSGMPGIDDLEATAAIRWFDYSTFGSDSTYKLGLRYRPIRDVTLRGTYSTAFRAPNIGELYAGTADNFASVKDPCRGPGAGGPALTAQCLAEVPAAGSGDTSSQLRSTVGGNPNVKAETAKIYTVGVVIEPQIVKNLSLTIDYYNMDIDKNISSIGENVILAGCYDGSNPGYCSLISRNPTTNFIDNIINTQANVGKLATSGIDFAIRYGLPSDFGRWAFSFDGAWLQKIDQTLADGRVLHGKNTFDLNTLNSFGQSGGTFPEWKFNASVLWGMKGFGAGLATRFLGSFHECGEPYTYSPGVTSADYAGLGLCSVDPTFQRKVSAYHTEDIFVGYTLATSAGKTNLTVGMQNMFDAAPAKIYNGFASATDQYMYDQMGRFMYARLTHTY